MLKIHSVPNGEKINTRYSININGVPAEAYDCRVSAMPFNREWPGHQRPLDQTEDAAFISFEAMTEVELRVRPEKPFEKAIVRPLSKHVSCRREGDEVVFTLATPGAYVLEPDGFHNALHIFFNPCRDFLAEATHSGNQVVHFAPGVHEIGDYRIESNTTVVIDGGAVVYGEISAYGAKNVSVVGYGIVDSSRRMRETGHCLPIDYDHELPRDRDAFYAYCRDNHMPEPSGCIRFFRCEDVCCDGVIMRDSPSFALLPADCDRVHINNVKTIGMWRYNSDGIDVFNSSDIRIENCFLRNFDDCIVIKGICGWDTRNNENITVRGCVVWCDWGRNLELGAETNAPEFRDIVFEDCDLIHSSTMYMDIHHHNRAKIHDIVFDNIRVEYTVHQLPDVYQVSDDMVYTGVENTEHPLLMSVMLRDMGLFSKDGLHGTVENVTFKNITAYVENGVPLPRSVLIGLSEQACVDGVRFENIVINGERAATLEAAGIDKNMYVYHVEIT